MKEERVLYLVVVEGTELGRWARLAPEKAIRIGRAKENDLALDDRAASRYHCELRMEGEKVTICDLGSANGTYVGLDRIDSRTLAIGDRVRVGTHVLLVSPTAARVPDASATDEDTVRASPRASHATSEIPAERCSRCGGLSPIDDKRPRDQAKPPLCLACQALEENIAASPFVPPVDVGGWFGRYQVEAALGKGGMATVYKVKDPVTGEYFTLKVLAAELTVDPEFVGRLVREAATMARLEHPGIVRFHRHGREGQVCFLVLEYVDGEDLDTILKRGVPLSPGFVARVGVHIARGLEHAHEHGVVHRDVKPSNVLVDTKGCGRLTDFGVARLLEEGLPRYTRTGSLLGSISYSAPELFEDAKVAGPPCDQFGLAATLYHALTGKPPYGTGPLHKILKRMFDGTVPSPRGERADVPEEFDRALARALALKPEDRHPSMGAFAAAIAPFASGDPSAPAGAV